MAGRQSSGQRHGIRITGQAGPPKELSSSDRCRALRCQKGDERESSDCLGGSGGKRCPDGGLGCGAAYRPASSSLTDCLCVWPWLLFLPPMSFEGNVDRSLSTGSCPGGDAKGRDVRHSHTSRGPAPFLTSWEYRAVLFGLKTLWSSDSDIRSSGGAGWSEMCRGRVVGVRDAPGGWVKRAMPRVPGWIETCATPRQALKFSAALRLSGPQVLSPAHY